MLPIHSRPFLSRSRFTQVTRFVGLALLACSGGSDGVAGNVLPDNRVTLVKVEPSSASLAVGGHVALTATAYNTSGSVVAGQAFTWSSSAIAVASVSALGEVTALASGSATIAARTAGISGSATITVTAVGPDTVVASIAVSPVSATVPLGTTVSLGAVATNAAGQTLAGKTFTWTSSAPAIAAVTVAGVVTGVAVGGPVTVTAATQGKSGTASIAVQGPPTSLGTIIVNGAQQFQTMLGWEGLGNAGYGECDPRAMSTYLPQVLDRAVNEVGINRLRIPLRAGYEHTTDLFLLYTAGQITFDQWKQQQFIPLNDNSDPFVMNPSGFNWSDLDYRVESLLLPLKQRLKARGDDVWFNLSYTGAKTGVLHRDSPEEYAELVLAAFQHLHQKYGFVPNSLEIVNEPDVGNWTAQPVGHLAVAAKRRLNQAGFFPDFIAPSASTIGLSIQYFDQIRPIPGVTQVLTDIAYHRYGGAPTASQLQGIAQRGAQYGMRTAMLEHGGSGHDDLHADLTLANVSAWQQFGLVHCGPGTSDNGGVYFIATGSQMGQNSPALITGRMTKFLRQYFRYVGLHAARVGATTADARYAPVAFRNANGKYVVVVKASAAGSFTVGGLPGGTYGIDYTTASDYMRPLADVTITGAQALTTAIPDVGVLTIYAK